MDLRRIVEEVEARKREEYAITAPEKTRPAGSASRGVAGSILLSVRERMLREDPEADVAALTEVIEPDRAVERPHVPEARVKHESTAVAIAREAARAEGLEKSRKASAGKPKDDFLARYLVMSQEFERRYHAKGWTDLVRKRSSASLRH